MLSLLTDQRFNARMFPPGFPDPRVSWLLFTPVVWWVVMARGFMAWGRP